MTKEPTPANPPAEKSKSSRQRSVAYPSYPIKACIDLVTKIDSHFSDVLFTNREAISKELKLSGGALLMNLSSCVQYDLLKLKQNEGYKPTAIFKKIKKPLPEENITDAYLECFNAPELYKKLILDFNGKQLPQESGLANILDRKYSVVGNASLLAAKTFLKNVSFIGLSDADNVLHIAKQEEFSIHADTDTRRGEKPKEEKKEEVLALPPSTTDYTTVEIPIFLSGAKRQAKITLPTDFNDEEISKIIKVLNGYLP